METEKLYERDSHLREFTARVAACEPGPGGTFLVTLDRTAFYPKGGGQPWDTGVLGGAAVTEVHSRDGAVVHTCGRPLAPGETVAGCIDWPRRLDLMQQHSGEHIVSGLIHAAFGYDNVGFHIGHDVVTIDFNGELDDHQLAGIERRANEAVWADRPVRCWYPEPAELAAAAYRSKKALTGPVRLVEFPEADVCACCGTHVQRTGEIGPIRLLGAVRFRGGVRVELLCGGRALAYDRAVWEQNRRISNLLSAKPLETAAAAERMAGELARARERAGRLEAAAFARMAADCAGRGDVLLLEPELDADGVRRLATAVGEACGGRAAVFSPEADGGCRYALCCPGGGSTELCRAVNAALQGRGGGRPPLAQGSVRAGADAVRAFFAREFGKEV